MFIQSLKRYAIVHKYTVKETGKWHELQGSFDMSTISEIINTVEEELLDMWIYTVPGLVCTCIVVQC